MAIMERYMSWIRKFSESAANAFKGQVIEGLQPIDFLHFFPLWYDIWFTRVARIIRELDLESKPYGTLQDALPHPSNIRSILLKLISSYRANSSVDREDYKIVANFFARMLEEACPNDPFALTSNPYHAPEEVESIIADVKWQKADSQSARKIGQVITATGSLVHGLYNDFVTDYAWEAYGPYSVSENRSLIMRHFTDLRPNDLWSEDMLPDTREVKIYSIYEDMRWELSFLGCHTLAREGNPVEGMREYAVYADGEVVSSLGMIDDLIAKLSLKASALYGKIREMSDEELKALVMKQECYQLKRLCDMAGVDWKPTEEMMLRVKNKPLLQGVFPFGRLIESTEEYEEVFGIPAFEKEVLGDM